MAIKYYPNRIPKNPAAIDRVLAQRKLQLVRGSADTTSAGLDVVISANTGWHVNNIKFTFSGATVRDFSAKIIGGRKVVADMNDCLWFQHEDTLPQNIVLDAGFYTGTELATELESKLDANVAFTAKSITFTVTYSDSTGLFTVTPSSGNLRYWNENKTVSPRYRDSIGGHLFGFTEDIVYGATVVSNETVFGLNQEAWIINEAASVVTENFFDDLKILDIDQAVRLETTTAAIRVDYEVNYEEIV